MAFLLAFGLIFVFPQGTLLLLFAGLGGLGIAVISLRILRTMERSMALARLKNGACPVCKQPIQQASQADHEWQCVLCGAAFAANGTEAEAPPDHRTA